MGTVITEDGKKMMGKGKDYFKGTVICKAPIGWTGTHVFKARWDKGSSSGGYIGVVKADYDVDK